MCGVPLTVTFPEKTAFLVFQLKLPLSAVIRRLSWVKTMGLSDGANYADVRRISDELEYAKAIMRRVHCKIINVSNRAIEETAGIILDYVQKNRDRHI